MQSGVIIASRKGSSLTHSLLDLHLLIHTLILTHSTIIVAFRRKFKDYREEAQVSDKDIRKIVRKYIGMKPSSIDYVYKGVELLNTPKSLKKLNEEALLKSKQMEEAYRQQVQNEVEDAATTTSGSDFIR